MEITKEEFYGERLVYLEGAIIEITSRLDIIRKYRLIHNFRDPIEHYTARIKSVESMKTKLRKHGLPENAEAVLGNIYDAAGIRVICTYIDDVYMVADMLESQSDIEVIQTKDYIKNPKESGYKSYHMLVSVPIFLSDSVVDTKVEIQILSLIHI